jgi:dolichol-phosphate mannosyltransferase
MRWLTALPVYNEARTLPGVLRDVRRVAPEVLVVNDGSTDGTGDFLARQAGLHVVEHPRNRGYGAALASAFDYALRNGFDALVTIDSDGQHDPSRIPCLLRRLDAAEIVSGSRYLRDLAGDVPAPSDRRFVNRQITRELNERFGLELTDAFCGFKAYRRSALARLRITESGWGMPLQVWVQAARLGLRVVEVAVPRVYLDPSRTFGGRLDDATQRLVYYRRVIEEATDMSLPSMQRCRCGRLVPVLLPACTDCGQAAPSILPA